MTYSKVREVMGCEIEKYKQILLLKHVLTQPETCLYNDVLTLGDDTSRKCIKHDKACVSGHDVQSWVDHI